AGDDGLATNGPRAECQRNTLERLSFKSPEEGFGPADDETAIGGPQRRYRNASRRKHLGPCAIGAEPRPAGAAERQHSCADFDRLVAGGSMEQEATLRVPAAPAMAKGKPHAGGIEPAQPGA